MNDSNDAAPFELFANRRDQSLDGSRPEAVEKRHQRGGRTARENLADLIEGSPFVEYGQLAVAAQRSRRSDEDLRTATAADGVITGIGHVNEGQHGAVQSRTALVVNDYTVLAGTQGYFHHKKIDRMLSVAKDQSLPVIMFTEGGGGRPGDTDVLVSMGGLDVPTFYRWASLAGVVPRIAVNSGYCFAGNAALFGGADIRIATASSCIGMAGPAMIEGGGLGTFAPAEIGPVKVHRSNGVVDIEAVDEGEAVGLAKQALGYWQGTVSDWEAEDQSQLRECLPTNRRMAYDVRKILKQVLDKNSLLEIRPHNGRAVIAGMARIEGIPFAFLASDCRHLGGAIDTEAAGKAVDLFRLASRWQLPVVSFIDTPGFMVGPESEAAGAPKLMADLFAAGASHRQPIVSIFLRRGYGLGAMALAGGSFDVPILTASWPEGEFGPMGLEGAVRLGFRQELGATPEGPERDALFNKLLAEMYERGRATEAASYLEIDAVIDPCDTRLVIREALAR